MLIFTVFLLFCKRKFDVLHEIVVGVSWCSPEQEKLVVGVRVDDERVV